MFIWHGKRLIKVHLALWICFWLMTEQMYAQVSDLSGLISQHAVQLGPPASDTKTYRTQIRLTEVRKNWLGRTRFKTQVFGADTRSDLDRQACYFYPASTVKLPVAALALEYLQVAFPKVNLQTRLHFGQVSDHLPGLDGPEQLEGEQPTLEALLKLIFVVSDNQAYNRLFEVLGHARINDRLSQLGMANTYIGHRVGVGALTKTEHETLPEIWMLNGKDTVGYLPKRTLRLPDFNLSIKLGTGYFAGDSLIREPFEFGEKNTFPLADQQLFLQKLVIPSAFKKKERLHLSKANRLILLKYMQMFPKKAGSLPVYQYPEGYCKFLIGGGDADTMPPYLDIYNKVGEAYGFLIDNAFIVDKRTGRRFFLAASVYVNADGIFNDDQYEYDRIGFPFLKQLGWLVVNGELPK
jgi:Beta-lactamase enzyme family